LPYLTLALVVSTVGCEKEPERHVDPRLVDALGLRGDELVHTISLGGRGSEEHIVPPRLEIGVGEVVQFVTVDRRVHAVRFPTDSLAQPEAAFIETTGQGASPPLLGLGSRFVVTFENAPPGRYPFLSSGHGEATGGIIFVR
jgi:plastocyanin